MHLRGQGSTEYLILLAVVITIALVVVSLLGFFPALTPDAKLRQSEAYWKGAAPIALFDAKAWDNGTLTLMVQNSGTESVSIRSVRVGQQTYTISQVYLSAGQRRPIEVVANLNSTALLCEGSLAFTYSTSQFNNLAQVGSRNIVIRCPRNVTSSTPPCTPSGNPCPAAPGSCCSTCNGLTGMCGCTAVGGGCSIDSNCCSLLYCDSGSLKCTNCKLLAAVCTRNGECCSGVCGPSLKCI
jgi:uncharacterized protein (UPF0333 family)